MEKGKKGQGPEKKMFWGGGIALSEEDSPQGA